MIPLSQEIYFFVVAGFLCVVPAALAPGLAAVFPARTMVILLIFIALNGRSLRGSRAMRAIFFTKATVAGVHCPKIVYPPFRSGVGPSVIKNCDPLEFGSPVLAYASRPGRSNRRPGAISRPKANPAWPEPVPAGSPP